MRTVNTIAPICPTVPTPTPKAQRAEAVLEQADDRCDPDVDGELAVLLVGRGSLPRGRRLTRVLDRSLVFHARPERDPAYR